MRPLNPLALSALVALLFGSCLQSDRPIADATASDATDATDATAPCDDDDDDDRYCVDNTTLQVCRGGRWVIEPCPSGLVCLDRGSPTCTSVAGQSDCRSMLDCVMRCYAISNHDETRNRCVVACYVDGTTEAQRELLALTGCLDDASCGSDLGCVGQHCRGPLAECYYAGHGGRSCREILNCQSGCASDTCKQSCASEGSFTAQSNLAMLELCVLTECGLMATTACRDRAEAGTCRPYHQACVGADL